jgi:hypothetical protein
MPVRACSTTGYVRGKAWRPTEVNETELAVRIRAVRERLDLIEVAMPPAGSAGSELSEAELTEAEAAGDPAGANPASATLNGTGSAAGDNGHDQTAARLTGTSATDVESAAGESDEPADPLPEPARIADELVHDVVAPAPRMLPGGTSSPVHEPEPEPEPEPSDRIDQGIEHELEQDLEEHIAQHIAQSADASPTVDSSSADPTPASTPPVATTPEPTTPPAPSRGPRAVRYSSDDIAAILSGRKPTA